MVISDLQYLESAETTAIVGGKKKRYGKKKGYGFGDINVNFSYIEQNNFAILSKNVKQSNYADVDQDID